MHPLGADGPFPILQYADDTMILLRGDTQQAAVIKQILDDFSNFSGLKINYHKSTFVPIGIDQQTSQDITFLALTWGYHFPLARYTMVC